MLTKQDRAQQSWVCTKCGKGCSPGTFPYIAGVTAARDDPWSIFCKDCAAEINAAETMEADRRKQQGRNRMMTFEDETMRHQFRKCRLDKLGSGDTFLMPEASNRLRHCALHNIGEVCGIADESGGMDVHVLGSGASAIFTNDTIVEPVTCHVKFQRLSAIQECSKGTEDGE